MELYHHIADTKSLPFGSSSGLKKTQSSIGNMFVEFHDDINDMGLGLRDFTIDDQMTCIISTLIFYPVWFLNKLKIIKMQPSFDLAVDQREIYNNNGLLLCLKRSGDVYTLGLCEFINDTLVYHSSNHQQIKGEIEEIEKNIVSKFIANSNDCDFNHINRCWHKKESNELYFNHEQILHKMLYQSVHSFQTYLLSANNGESLYFCANQFRRNIIRSPLAAAFNVRSEINYFAGEKTPIDSYEPFEFIKKYQYIDQYKCKSLTENNQMLLSLLSCMQTSYAPEIIIRKEAKEKLSIGSNGSISNAHITRAYGEHTQTNDEYESNQILIGNINNINIIEHPIKLLDDFIHSSNSELRNGNVDDNMYYKRKSSYYFESMNGIFPFNIAHNDVSQIIAYNYGNICTIYGTSSDKNTLINTPINTPIPNVDPTHASHIPTIEATQMPTVTPTNEITQVNDTIKQQTIKPTPIPTNITSNTPTKLPINISSDIYYSSFYFD